MEFAADIVMYEFIYSSPMDDASFSQSNGSSWIMQRQSKERLAKSLLFLVNLFTIKARKSSYLSRDI
jgi:hypothetical protein